MTIEVSDLGIDMWPGIGFAERGVFIDAWRQFHHAAAGLVELGKSWGEPRPDDSHCAYVWSGTDGGWIVSGEGADGEVLGWIDFGSGSVWLERDDPQEGAWIDLEGRTAPAVREWVRSTAGRLCGSAARQDSSPAPDLPEHAVGRGAMFVLDDVDARGDLEALYEGAGLLLGGLRGALGESCGAGEEEAEPKLWPHHFDAASLFVVGRDDEAMTRTIGVGVSPPDGLEGSGYWYVSPWAGDGIDGNPVWPDLAAGRWHDRDGGTPMALLSLDDVRSCEDAEGQLELVSLFITSAFNACVTNLL